MGLSPRLKSDSNKTTSYRVFLSTIHFFPPYDCYVLLVVVGFSLSLLHDGLVSGTTAHLTHNRASQGISCSLGTFHPLLHPTGLIRLIIDRYTKLDPHITKLASVYYEIRGSYSILRESTRYPKLNAVCKLEFAIIYIIITRCKISPLKFGYLGEYVYLCSKNNKYEQGIRTD